MPKASTAKKKKSAPKKSPSRSNSSWQLSPTVNPTIAVLVYIFTALSIVFTILAYARYH